MLSERSTIWATTPLRRLLRTTHQTFPLLHRVGFEPTQHTLPGLKSGSLDHSDIDALVLRRHGRFLSPLPRLKLWNTLLCFLTQNLYNAQRFILLNNYYHCGWYYVSPFPHFILHPCLKPPKIQIIAAFTPLITLKTVRHRFWLGYCLSISSLGIFHGGPSPWIILIALKCFNFILD